MAEHLPAVALARVGVCLIDATLAVLSGELLYNNYRRRLEVVKSLSNAREALEFTKRGVYLPQKELDAPTTFRPWWWWYVVGIVVGAVGIGVLLFGPPVVTKG